MVRKYLNQDYRKLKRDHQQRGELFTDPRFPPEASSVFLSGQNDQDIVWKRPRVRIACAQEVGGYYSNKSTVVWEYLFP